MTSEARIAANRRNAEKSTGPRTEQGKAVVAQNAVTHGLWARRPILKDEDPQEFELHRTRMLQGLAPDGPKEEPLAERIVALWWRLKRAERMQDETLDYLLEADRGDSWVKCRRQNGDPSARAELAFGRAVARDFAEARTLDRLTMCEWRIEGSLYRTMNELRQVQRQRNEAGEHNAVHGPPVGWVAPPDSVGSSQVLEIGPVQAMQTGGSVKAEGLGDGEWANHRQSFDRLRRGAALDAATQDSRTRDVANSFDGGDSSGSDHPQDHGQTSLPVPPGEGDSVKQSQSAVSQEDHRQAARLCHNSDRQTLFFLRGAFMMGCKGFGKESGDGVSAV
jgi:hypothetical protein